MTKGQTMTTVMILTKCMNDAKSIIALTGCKSPVSSLSKVLFPTPFGPTMATAKKQSIT